MDLANVDEEISWNTLQSLGKEHNQHNLGKLLKFLNHPKPELRGFWGDSLAKLSHWGPKLNFWTSKNSTKQATFVLFQLKMVVSHQLHLGIKGGMIQVCSKNSTAAIYLHTSLTLESSTYSNFLSSSYPSSNCTWHYRSFSQLFTSCIHRLIHMLSYLYIIYIYTQYINLAPPKSPLHSSSVFLSKPSQTTHRCAACTKDQIDTSQLSPEHEPRRNSAEASATWQDGTLCVVPGATGIMTSKLVIPPFPVFKRYRYDINTVPKSIEEYD